MDCEGPKGHYSLGINIDYSSTFQYIGLIATSPTSVKITITYPGKKFFINISKLFFKLK